MLDEAMQCPVDELEAQIVDVRRRHRRCEYELACLLVAWDQRECARSRGDTDTGGWAVRVLGLSRRETAELLRIGRRLPDLPHVRSAFEDGHLGWTQVREIVRVAEPETDEAWTARAQEVSSRRLEREVAACRRGDAPPDFEDMELPSRVLLRFDVATGDAMVIRKALAVLRAEAGDRGEVDDGVLLATLARASLRDGDSPERPMPEERYRVVIEECPTCHSPAGSCRHPRHGGWFRAAPAARPTWARRTASIVWTPPWRRRPRATTSAWTAPDGSATPSRRRRGGGSFTVMDIDVRCRIAALTCGSTSIISRLVSMAGGTTISIGAFYVQATIAPFTRIDCASGAMTPA